MSINLYQEKIRDLRFAYIDRKKQRKADLFIGLWLELKISVVQSQSMRSIINQEKQLNNFFSKQEIITLLEENKQEAQKALYAEILDSALLYQSACLEDRHYGSKFFNLIRLKDDEIAYKAAKEVYNDIISALLGMNDYTWRNYMITALHVAYQEVFNKNALKPEIMFDKDDPQLLDKFTQIINNTLKNEGAE
ncbi:MAG TPA: hypothetical protein GXZ43_02000 [Clostridiaceae bacterium]|nr:hypothetical protein [Clostridiaceae bacterium]